MRSPIHSLPTPLAVRLVRAAIGAAIGMASAPAALAATPNFTTLYTFQGGTDGGSPFTESLLPGPNGSLYGSTRPGASGSAAVFQLSPPAERGTAWTYTVLQSFVGDQNGGRPTGLLAGPEGSLYGETIYGGNTATCSPGCGLIFQLLPPAAGKTAWTETILYAFSNGTDGAYPRDGLVPDGHGNLFGTTVQSDACAYGCGTVFELSPPAAGQTAWTLTTLYTFRDDKTGLYPGGKLLPDQSGGFYGITWGGADGDGCNYEYAGCGTVYHLTPPRKTGAAWKKTTLYRFTGGPDGQTPYTTLDMDDAGHIFGMTSNGGLRPHCPTFHQSAPGGCGTVFELTPPMGDQNAWTLSLPWQFTGMRDGNQPVAAGLSPFKTKYVTTTAGNGVRDFGSIDVFSPGAAGQPWSERTLFKFTNDANGAAPESYLLERDGVFYGMTHGVSGPASYGTIYSFTP